MFAEGDKSLHGLSKKHLVRSKHGQHLQEGFHRPLLVKRLRVLLWLVGMRHAPTHIFCGELAALRKKPKFSAAAVVLYLVVVRLLRRSLADEKKNRHAVTVTPCRDGTVRAIKMPPNFVRCTVVLIIQYVEVPRSNGIG